MSAADLRHGAILAIFSAICLAGGSLPPPAIALLVCASVALGVWEIREIRAEDRESFSGLEARDRALRAAHPYRPGCSCSACSLKAERWELEEGQP